MTVIVTIAAIKLLKELEIAGENGSGQFVIKTRYNELVRVEAWLTPLWLFFEP